MLRSRFKYLLQCCLLSLGVMFDSGYLTTYPNTSEDSFRELLNQTWTTRNGEAMSDKTFTWLWSLVTNTWFVGYIVGSGVLGWVTERFGRTLPIAGAGMVSAVGTGVAVVGASEGDAYWLVQKF